MSCCIINITLVRNDINIDQLYSNCVAYVLMSMSWLIQITLVCSGLHHSPAQSDVTWTKEPTADLCSSGHTSTFCPGFMWKFHLNKSCFAITIQCHTCYFYTRTHTHADMKERRLACTQPRTTWLTWPCWAIMFSFFITNCVFDKIHMIKADIELLNARATRAGDRSVCTWLTLWTILWHIFITNCVWSMDTLQLRTWTNKTHTTKYDNEPVAHSASATGAGDRIVQQIREKSCILC